MQTLDQLFFKIEHYHLVGKYTRTSGLTPNSECHHSYHSLEGMLSFGSRSPYYLCANKSWPM